MIASSLGIELSELELNKLEGHFGNEMTFAKARIVGKRANEVCERIFENLTNTAKITLTAQLEQSVDEHDALYLRLDRQSMGGNLRLSDDEPIRIKLKPKIREIHSKMIRSYREALS